MAEFLVHSGGKSSGLIRSKICRLKLLVIVLRLKYTFIKYLKIIFIYASARDFLEISCTCLILLLVYFLLPNELGLYVFQARSQISHYSIYHGVVRY